MPKLCVRFGVRSDDGRCSDIWKCWTSAGAGKRDVYLSSPPMGKSALKLSLHDGGQWHIGFDASQRERLFEPGAEPTSRFLGQWKPPIPSHDYQLASRIFFPWSCPSVVRPDVPPDTAWIRTAAEGQMVEVAVFLMNGRTPPTDWPGKTAMGTKLVGRFDLEQSGEVILVCREVPMFEDAEPRAGTPHNFRDQTDSDLLKADRMVAWGQAPDGSIMFLESKITVSATTKTVG